MRLCSISETDNSCKVCCRDPSGRCLPYVDAEQKNLFLRKGKPCTVGFCDMNVSIYLCTVFIHVKLLSCKCLALKMEGNQNTDGATSDHCPLVRVR